MRQALVGWKQTVQRIGKGTGKNAPKYRAKARSLMVKCQNAVPGWIMPIGKALENFNPVTNKFDIVIIDEASQCDISSLPILYMGKKQIIVGDDKQVSPMAVGVEIDKITSLQDLYIKGKIPNDHLYDVKTSIYDVVASTAPSLMLREHFRCVPEIIGFSNWLSYDGKIKPLRDCSNSVILPAVVNYRVDNGRREGDNKTNSNEAEAIVALLQACIAQPEYAGKTFGVISLLGDEQVKVLQAKINKYIDAKECNVRKILCGNASNFQGDERDIVFLSIVDSANGNGPIRKQGYGVDDAFRKRYNVAASRARDQLWVVDSLDPANDLQPDDIRKKLIDYSINPKIYSGQIKKIEQKAESPFEASVAKALVAKGYHLEQQWEVGAYRLDMVAICDEKKVAIECDGERYHSGEEKIREDMERQTILERLGWRFIRIRGSEYYRNPEKAIERVINELSERGIEPEENNYAPQNADRETELLQRVKRRAYEILKGRLSKGDIDSDIVESALDIKNNEMFQGKPIKTSAEVEVGKSSKSVNYPFPKSTVLLTKTPNSRNRSADKSVVIGAKKRVPVAKPTPQKNHSEQTVLPFMEESEADKSKKVNVIEFLKNENIPYTDKRSKGGAIWIVGGKKFEGVVEKLKKQGYIFNYTGKGGRATKNQPGWYMK